MAESILSGKTCPGCNVFKFFCEFSPHKNTRDRLQPKCKECRREYARIHAKSYAWTAFAKINKEKQKKYDRDRYLANSRKEYKKAQYQKTKQSVIDRAKKWAKDHSEIMAARAMQRLTLQRQATPLWANLELIFSFYQEAKNRGVETGIKWHVDHIVPIKSKLVCGLHVESNLRVIPASENIAKSNRYWPDMP